MDQEVIEQADLRQGAWLETVCAFANGHGGSLLVEVPESRRGKSSSLETLEWLPVRIYEELGITCEVNLVMVGGRMGVEVTVLPSAAPVSCEGRFFQRRDGETALLVGADLVRFLRGRDTEEEAPWERRPVPGARLDDLDPAMLARLGVPEDDLRSAPAVVRCLAAAGLADEATGFLNHAGVLLAHRSPDQVIDGAFVRVGFFDDDASPRPAQRLEARGPLPSQADQVVDAVLGPRRGDRVVAGSLPAGALREALLNALAHKDYASGAPVKVSVMPDRVTVVNVGRPPAAWTAETLGALHSARPANPALAAALGRLGAVGAWGGGCALMAAACAEAGLPAPRFALGADEVAATLPLEPAPPDPLADLRLSRVDRRVLERLRADDRPTAAVLAADLAVSDSTVRRSLRRLTQLRLIERIGSTKTGFWHPLA